MQIAENFHGEQSRDKPRHKSLVKMVVRVRSATNLPLFGNVAPCGESEITVYVDDVDKVLAQVETDLPGIAAAEKEFAREIADAVKAGLDPALFKGTTADLVKMLAKPENLPEEIAAKHKSVLATTSKSMPAAFERLHGRGILPLVSAEVVKGSEQPEHHISTRLEEARLLQSMLYSPPAGGITAEQIAELIAKGVREGVREELARIQAAAKKG